MNDRFFSKHSQTADRAKSFSLQNIRHESLFKQIYLRSRLNIGNFDKTSVFLLYIFGRWTFLQQTLARRTVQCDKNWAFTPDRSA